MREFKSNIIKEKRKLRNMSQAQLGDIVGSQAMVSRIENGQILQNAQTIFILCNKLEITVEEYFYSIFGPDQNTTTFRNNLDKLYMQGSIDELRKIFSHYKHHKSLDIETKHRMLMVQSTIFHILIKLLIGVSTIFICLNLLLICFLLRKRNRIS
ncbi:helix-turn-helix transcriptional regulator [Leuconostoc mesenteroides]|uniref:helix-turn-helix transcriptional regulator n=1 Tax=Leuconostoc mesenteroides TaxID=1245 RepID=UPI001EF4250A|nr:helix-turn-helix domain-containing protein [Leuconostoc mesenteroides]